MTKINELRWCIEFSCQNVADTQSDTIKKVQVTFGDEAMGVAVIKFRFNCLKNGRESIESNTRPDWPSTSRNQKLGVKIRALVTNGKPTHNRQGNGKLCWYCLRYGSTQTIFTEDLGMRMVTAKL